MTMRRPPTARPGPGRSSSRWIRRAIRSVNGVMLHTLTGNEAEERPDPDAGETTENSEG